MPTGPATVVLMTPLEEVLVDTELAALELEELDKLELVTAGLDELAAELTLLLLFDSVALLV